eukprot:3301053-Prymnesium_polylepis.1
MPVGAMAPRVQRSLARHGKTAAVARGDGNHVSGAVERRNPPWLPALDIDRFLLIVRLEAPDAVPLAPRVQNALTDRIAERSAKRDEPDA